MTQRPSYILIRPLEGEGQGFVAYAIGLDGCVVEGGTEEETLANIKAAIAEWRREEPVLAKAS
jgi:predicted RNase H-like HicB family nuclease